jgi:PTS system N-acetylglucosamine-specific IIC component
MMMFGLPAACLAMIHEARFPKVAAGILLSAALTSFLTGITEPIEFAFIFVTPVLFVIHAFLTGTSLFICYLLNIHMAFGFSAGLIDYLINFNAKNTTNPLLILVVGVVYAFIYYFLFRFFIRTFNLGTPGRGETSQRGPAPAKQAKSSAVTSNDTLAAQVIEALAGSKNIESVEGCITRLRLFIKDTALIDEPRLKGLGASGVMKQGQIVQVVMGMQSDDIASRMKHLIAESANVTSSE